MNAMTEIIKNISIIFVLSGSGVVSQSIMVMIVLYKETT
jgi:hypothetical protein